MNYNFDLNSKISTNILLIIIIFSIIIFISGLLHILFKFLLTPSPQNRRDHFNDNVTSLEGPLQQLFNLHDSGLDQSLINKLPIFHYKSIIGLKIGSFDCSVCLCEFETEDKLRLLPKCSHAFHVDCIDTWLLSHSSCPLCRSNLLLSDFSFQGMVHVSESNDIGLTHVESGGKYCDPHVEMDSLHEKVVKLGKFRKNNNSIGDSRNLDERRCYSMGSYEYIMDQEAILKVHVSTKKPLMSERGYDPMVKGMEKSVMERESFSLSKIWLRGKKEKQKDSSDCSSVSTRFSNQGDHLETENGVVVDEENKKSENSESLEAKTPSFAKRTMLWIAGRQNKVVHHSSTSHV